MNFDYSQCKASFLLRNKQKGSPRSTRVEAGFVPILMLIGVLILAVVVGGAYYLGTTKNSAPKVENPLISQAPQRTVTPQVTSKSGETSDWKTFTSDKYKYSFKYPDNWFIVSSVVDQKLYDKSPETLGPAYSISFYVNTGDTEDMVSKPIGFRKEVADKVFEEKIGNTQIDGINTVEFKTIVLPGSQTDTAPSKGIIVPVQGGVLVVSLMCIENKCETYKDLFNKILSSIKFSGQAEAEEFIDFNGRRLMVKRVGEGEYCEGRTNTNLSTYSKCSTGLKCEQPLGSAADSPGTCVKE